MMRAMSTIAFARGVPSPDALPVELLRGCVDAALREDGRTILSYGGGGGYGPLRELLGEQHGVDPSRVIVTTGSLQAFVFIVEHLVDAADGAAPTVVVENPTYDRPLLVARRSGADVVAIEVDGDGMRVDAFEQSLQGVDPALTYVIPSFQNPAGATMSEPRRARLLDLARERRLLLLEDDPYGRLHFDAPAPRTLFERSGGAEVIYASSFSKIVSPGLRVGYVVLPEALAGAIEQRANDTYISAALIGQAAVYRFVRDGHLEANVDRCRGMLRDRCDAMCEELEAHLPEATFVRPGGGYFLWVTLPDELSADELLPIAAEHGVSFVPGSAFGDGHGSAMRLAFSYPSVDEVREGVRRLARAVVSMRALTV